jgi:hypothetical protein
MFGVETKVGLTSSSLPDEIISTEMLISPYLTLHALEKG